MKNALFALALAFFLTAAVFLSGCTSQVPSKSTATTATTTTDLAEFQRICKQDGNQWMDMREMRNGRFVSESCFGCMSPDGMNHFCNLSDYENFMQGQKG